MSAPWIIRLLGLSMAFFYLLLPCARADKNVVVTSTANSDYTTRKFGDKKPRVETYVFMQGRYFEGSTVDRSIDKMPFRRIAEYLAPELAKQQYLPTTEAKNADLLLVVHWGTTLRHLSVQEMTTHESPRTDTSTSASTLTQAAINDPDPTQSTNDAMLRESWVGDTANQVGFDVLEQISEQVGGDMARSSNVALLGYGRHLMGNPNQPWSGERERTLRNDLGQERYFIIVKAYDLKEKIEAGRTRRSVWTLHMNMSSSGNNFRTALAGMCHVASNYFGQATDSVKTVKSDVREGKVTLAPLVILGEVKETNGNVDRTDSP